MSKTIKFINLYNKAQPTLNPQWIKINYPDTYKTIQKDSNELIALKKENNILKLSYEECKRQRKILEDLLEG